MNPQLGLFPVTGAACAWADVIDAHSVGGDWVVCGGAVLWTAVSAAWGWSVSD